MSSPTPPAGLPAPAVGMVFFYEFLWEHERIAGKKPAYPRPVVIAKVLVPATPGLASRVVVLPISTAGLGPGQHRVLMSPVDVAALDLDPKRKSEVVLDEYNTAPWSQARIGVPLVTRQMPAATIAAVLARARAIHPALAPETAANDPVAQTRSGKTG